MHYLWPHAGRAGRPTLRLMLCAFLVSCTGIPEGVTPVQGFELERYLGTWYEIARLDHSFERGLNRVTASYARREDGGVSVINRGFSESDGWQQAEGKAYFVGSPDVGHLKVSFFGPFYGSYIVFELDEEDYQYAFVSGFSTHYLWLLARTPTVEAAVIDRFRERADELGFDTGELIFPEH